jgi:transposase
LKAKVVLEMLPDTRPVTELAAAYQIAPRWLHRWRREVVDRLPDLFADPAVAARQAAGADAPVEHRYAQIGKLTPQVAWLQKQSGRDPDA